MLATFFQQFKSVFRSKPYTSSFCLKYRGVEYTRSDILRDLRDYHNIIKRDRILEHFGMRP